MTSVTSEATESEIIMYKNYIQRSSNWAAWPGPVSLLPFAPKVYGAKDQNKKCEMDCLCWLGQRNLIASYFTGRNTWQLIVFSLSTTSVRWSGTIRGAGTGRILLCQVPFNPKDHRHYVTWTLKTKREPVLFINTGDARYSELSREWNEEELATMDTRTLASHPCILRKAIFDVMLTKRTSRSSTSMGKCCWQEASGFHLSDVSATVYDICRHWTTL